MMKAFKIFAAGFVALMVLGGVLSVVAPAEEDVAEGAGVAEPDIGTPVLVTPGVVEDDDADTVSTVAPTTTAPPATTVAPATTAAPAPVEWTDEDGLGLFRAVLSLNGIVFDKPDADIVDAAGRFCADMADGGYDTVEEITASLDVWYWDDAFMDEVFSFTDMGGVLGALVGSFGDEACVADMESVVAVIG